MQDTNFKNLPKEVLWVITSKCNYDCYYCINKKIRHDLGLEVKNANLFLRNIKKKLDKSWGFVISGGEPFLHKDFFKIVKGLVKLGHRVDIVTNFSADPKEIIRFLRLGGNICASLRLEYEDPDNFLKKILTIEKSFPVLRDHLVIASLATNETISRLEKIKKKFFEKGYRFFIWLTQLPSPRPPGFLPYSDKEKKIIEHISKKYNLKQFQKQAEYYGTFGADFSMISFKGQKCWAGCRYFYMYPNGDAVRCPSRTKTGYLGNILKKNFKLLAGPTKCYCKICTHTCYFLWKVNNPDIWS